MPDKQLLSLGPFIGLQASTDAYYLEKGHGIQASNVDISYRYGAFASALGRNVFASITLPAGYSLQCVTPILSFSGEQPNITAKRVYVFSSVSGTNSYQGWYDPDTKTTSQLKYASAFTQAVQFGSALWTNGGDKIYFLSSGALDSDGWQLSIPYPYSYNITGTWETTSGSAPADTYTYAITLRKAESWALTGSPPTMTLQPDIDSLQESSPVFSTSVTVAAGQQPGFTVPASIGLQGLVSGVTIGNDTYYGCLYRSRIENPTFQFVDYLANIPQVNDHNGDLSIIDTYSDASIANNAELIIHHDVPPILGQTYPGAIANNSSADSLQQQSQQVSFTYKNPSFVTKHKNRMWVFTMYPTQAIGPFPAVPPETVSFQPQLWYSDAGTPWSFDDVDSVLPVGPEDTPGNYAVENNVQTEAPWESGMLEDTPMGIASTGSILVMFKSQSLHMLLGDSPSEFLQGVRKVCDIGCVSTKSIVAAEGGVFWLAPQGVYFFNGGEPAYIGEDARGLIESLPWSQLQNAVGSYRDRTYYLSFSNTTLAYYLPAKKWYTLPYGTSLAVWSSYNQNLLLFANGSNLDSIDVNPATDLGNAIVSTWQGQITDSGAPGQLKAYTRLQVVAPIQPGTVKVTLDLDPNAGITNTYSATWDLSKGNGAHVVSLPQGMMGYEAQLTLETTTASTATSPIVIRSVSVNGEIRHDLVPPQTTDLISAFRNGAQTYPRVNG